MRAGRRREFAAFGWEPDEVPDPQDPATFRRSKLDWDERSRGHHREMLDWYRALVALRRGTPALLDGRRDAVVTRVDEEAGTLAVERGPVTVAVNLGAHGRELDVEGRVALASEHGVGREGRRLHLPPDAVAVLLRDACEG